MCIDLDFVVDLLFSKQHADDADLADVDEDDVAFVHNISEVPSADSPISPAVFEEAENFFNSGDEDDGPPKKRKRANLATRQKWSSAEEKEIQDLFKKYIDTGKRPSPATCEKALVISRANKGKIGNRSKDTLKKKSF